MDGTCNKLLEEVRFALATAGDKLADYLLKAHGPAALEANEILRMLDEVERRVTILRRHISALEPADGNDT